MVVTQVSATYLTNSRRVVVVVLSLRRWNAGGISPSGKKGRAISFQMYLYVGLSEQLNYFGYLTLVFGGKTPWWEDDRIPVHDSTEWGRPIITNA